MEFLKLDRKFGQVCVDDQDIDCMTYGHMIKVKKAVKKTITGFAAEAKLAGKAINTASKGRIKPD